MDYLLAAVFIFMNSGVKRGMTEKVLGATIR